MLCPGSSVPTCPQSYATGGSGAGWAYFCAGNWMLTQSTVTWVKTSWQQRTKNVNPRRTLIPAHHSCCCRPLWKQRTYFFFWASSSNHCLAALDLGTGVEQPFDCLIFQNRQVVQSMRRTMNWILEDNMVDGLFFCATFTGRRGGHTPFVQAGEETCDTGAEAVKLDPGCSWEGHSGGCGYRCRRWKCGVLWYCPPTTHSIGDPPTAPHVCCCCQMEWWVWYTKSGSDKCPYNENHGQWKRYKRHIANVSITPVIIISALQIDALLCGGYKWVSQFEAPCLCTRWPGERWVGQMSRLHGTTC